MASSLALRRLLSSSVVPRSRYLLRPEITSRLLNTNAVQSYNDAENDHGLDVDRRDDRSLSRRRDDFFPDVFDPFSPARSVSQVLNLMDQLMENPLFSAARARRGWDIKEKEDALYLRMDMPGLSKEDVKLSLEQDNLVIRGEGKDGGEEGERGNRRFTSRIGLPEKFYKIDEIKAEMKDGVLKVVVPKMKEEERNNVREIEVN